MVKNGKNFLQTCIHIHALNITIVLRKTTVKKLLIMIKNMFQINKIITKYLKSKLSNTKIFVLKYFWSKNLYITQVTSKLFQNSILRYRRKYEN